MVKSLADKYPSENLLLVTHGKNCTRFITIYASLDDQTLMKTVCFQGKELDLQFQDALMMLR